MDKKLSLLWAAAAGLLFPVLSAVFSALQISGFSAALSFANFVWFFLAGSLIGLSLVYLLRRSESRAGFYAILAAFVVGVPFSLFGMSMGSVTGAVGVFFLGVSPAVFLMLIGYFLGRLFSRN